MNKKDRQKLYQDAINKWGEVAQLEMAQEEATELALAVRKFIRQPNKKRENDLAGELADNEIMNEQLNYIFPNLRTQIDEIKLSKLNRLRKRLDNSQFN